MFGHKTQYSDGRQIKNDKTITNGKRKIILLSSPVPTSDQCEQSICYTFDEIKTIAKSIIFGDDNVRMRTHVHTHNHACISCQRRLNVKYYSAGRTQNASKRGRRRNAKPLRPAPIALYATQPIHTATITSELD